MEFLGWSNEKPTEPGWYWFKERINDEDWKAEKVYIVSRYRTGFFKPAEIR